MLSVKCINLKRISLTRDWQSHAQIEDKNLKMLFKRQIDSPRDFT